ncbi:MAG: ABC transporter permease [Treponema sp.]|jgi:peptide/nickel transport system permease protein|nr:ABC transporter permease [Treponema sp.]
MKILNPPQNGPAFVPGPRLRRSSAAWGRFKKNKPAMAALALFLGMLAVLIFADLLAPYEKGIRLNPAARLAPPGGEYLFGADEYGRDVFTRVIHGGRLSLSLGFAASAAAMLLALIPGCAAGLLGGAADEVITRIMDAFLCIPSILLSLAAAAALGPGFGNLLIALVISHVPGFTRFVRSVTLTIVVNDYIEAARASGTSGLGIITRHILRNALGPILVQTAFASARIILIAAGLSFIGLGVRPPAPEWGAMLSEARLFLRRAPHLMFFPSSALVLSSFSLNFLGDGLRDALDVRFET